MKLPPLYKRNVVAEQLRLEVPDHELIRKLTELGMPRKDARALLFNSGLRVFAMNLYYDARDAEKGDRAAKERIDYCRHMWNERAKVERELARNA